MSNSFLTEFSGKKLALKTNYVADQADGAILATYGDTVVLVTVVSLKDKREGLDFFPLTVDYQEMTFAAGKIPGGFFKREGRPNEREILTSRIIDRSIRPLFPEGYHHETQVVATVLSVDSEHDPDVTALIATSAALEISNIPFKGPIAAVRVGMIDGKFVCNASIDEMGNSDLNLFLAGRMVPRDGTDEYDINLVMLEGGAKEIDDHVIVDAISYGLAAMRPIIDLQLRMRQEIGKDKREIILEPVDEELLAQVTAWAEKDLREAYHIPRKQERYAQLDSIRKGTSKEFSAADATLKPVIAGIIEEMERRIVRDIVLKEQTRIDGRGFQNIRPISSEVGILPRVHGSALFNRGETQALAALTLGTSNDEQRMDYITGEETRSFLLHYNFPPYSVGEAKPLRSPGRREIGHGALARRALLAVLPSSDSFPYTVRIVSEILSSNGSSSMATVCAGMLALMDAGVPVKGIAAGIAMGLLKEDDKIVILSDILGDEDHCGDMDFKVCGTKKGITSLQMDIKIDRLTEDVLRMALDQAKAGRFYIIDKLMETMAESRADISIYAPRIMTVKVRPERVRDVIGSGGKNIRQIVNETGVKIDVEDDGTVTIASADAEAAEKAICMVKWLTEEAEIGKIYRGVVKRVVDFGAFVEILPGTEGLVHISHLAKERVNKVTDILKEGDGVNVKVLEIDRQGKIRLSRKEALGDNGQ